MFISAYSGSSLKVVDRSKDIDREDMTGEKIGLGAESCDQGLIGVDELSTRQLDTLFLPKRRIIQW